MLPGHTRNLWPSILMCCCLLAPEGAHAANPSLFAERNGIDDESRKLPLRLAGLTIEVTIDGSIAETTLTADFAGASNEVLEGHFSLVLPDGAVVNGYALDIEGQMIEGTLLPRPKARDVYESKVRKSIDPGLAEVSSSNVFSTKVFPILEATGRTIRVSFVAPVHRTLTLPLATEQPPDAVDVRVKARNVESPPALTLPSGLTPTWQRTRDGYVATASTRSTNLHGALAVAPTQPRRTALVSQDGGGQRFFQIRDSFRPGFVTASRPERVRVYWDASLSRRDDRLAEEIALLERYLRFTVDAPVDLVIFNSTTARVHSSIAAASIKATLEHVEYRGGTSFAIVDGLRLSDADVCLLFSDGAATIDRRDTFNPDCTMKAIASATDADRSFLMRLIRENGGALIRPGVESADEMYRRLIDSSPALISATSAEGKPLAFSVIENDANGWFVVGEAPRTDEVVLQFKGRRGRTFDMRYGALKLQRTRFDGAAALWASDRITQLTVAESTMGDVERVSRRYSVASPSLAFVVLETPEDYANADIVPPKNYPQEGWEEYLDAKQSNDEQRLTDRTAHLEDLLAAWNERKQWWEQKFDPRAKATRLPRKRSSGRFESSSGGRAFGGSFGGGAGLEEIIVTGMYVRESYQESPIAIAPMSMDRPYLRALEGAAPQDAAALLTAQEKDHGQFPAFYLDTAEWLYQQDKVAEASEMLLSALELPLSNDETKAIVADRLLRYGYVDRAIWLYEQTARIASHRPQPKMQLALALAKRASLRATTARRDLQRAISLLNDVAVTPWDGAYQGVALTALTEANALIARLKRSGGGRIALAPELIALLDLDVRVVIQWNTAATDVDLWIDEPNGERAIYDNPLTAIGGRLSDDMTEGYGPEEYLLRRAGPGEYRVYIDVYATDSINPNGATTVTARLIHDFGRPTEHEEAIDIELLPDESGERFVGAIRIGGTE